jgi:DNA ligase-1
MRLRLGGERAEHRLNFGEATEFHTGELPFRLTLLPAGHILGSSMAYIEVGGQSLLYTGDFKLRSGLSCEPCQLRPADVLIMETTFGRPHYRLPDPAQTWQALANFCHETLAAEATPVLMAYSLGKTQEVLTGLKTSGLTFALHEQAHSMTQAYEAHGVSFPAYTCFDGDALDGKVLIWPPSALRSKLLKGLPRLRTAAITGWAMDASCRFRMKADAAFALSDHADYPELLEAVKRVNPKQVWTLHGSAADFADSLRQHGYQAAPLSQPDQLSLILGC